MTELPPQEEEPQAVSWMVLRAEGDGCWIEHGVYEVDGAFSEGEQRREVLSMAADQMGVPESGVTFAAVADWLPVTVRETLVPQRVFEGL